MSCASCAELYDAEQGIGVKVRRRGLQCVFGPLMGKWLASTCLCLLCTHYSDVACSVIGHVNHMLGLHGIVWCCCHQSAFALTGAGYFRKWANRAVHPRCTRLTARGDGYAALFAAYCAPGCPLPHRLWQWPGLGSYPFPHHTQMVRISLSGALPTACCLASA